MIYMCVFEVSVYLPMFMYKYVYLYICCPMQQRVVVRCVHTHYLDVICSQRRNHRPRCMYVITP